MSATLTSGRATALIGWTRQPSESCPTAQPRRWIFRSERIGFNGGIFEAVANVHPNIGLVADFSATFKSTDFLDVRSGRTFHAKSAALHFVVWTALQLAQFHNADSFWSRAAGRTHYHAKIPNGDIIAHQKMRPRSPWPSGAAWTSGRPAHRFACRAS